MFFGYGFNFETVGGIDGLDFASTIDCGFALAQIPQEALIGLVQNQSARLLLKIGVILHLDYMKLFTLNLIEAADDR